MMAVIVNLMDQGESGGEVGWEGLVNSAGKSLDFAEIGAE